jgi:CO/xanthine dehydrogenase FAD-binding subunit
LIAFNFDYYVPGNIGEAVRLFEQLKTHGKKPVYYSGGTEVITFARRDNLYTDAVIDLKGMPECTAFYMSDDRIIIGSTVTLTAVQEAKFFPLLTETSAFAADHTSRNKITFGGNICGRIIYKEAVLTPLVTDALVVIAGRNGMRTVPISHIFKKRLYLEEGEFLVQIIIDGRYGQMQHYSRKRRKIGTIGYPLVSMAAINVNGQMRFAFSGVCGFPFRSFEIEEYLNNRQLSYEQRIDETLKHLPDTVLSNVEGGKEYRIFVLQESLKESLNKLEDGRNVSL